MTTKKSPTYRKKKQVKPLKAASRSSRKTKQRKVTKIDNKNKKKQKKHTVSLTKRPVTRKEQLSADIPLNSEMGENLLSRNQQSLSVIISVHNEESTIRDILGLAMQLKPKEIIVIENGSTDRTLEICKEYPVRCFAYPNRLGHDVGRAVGAKEATGEVLLFLDGDLPVEPSSLLPFVKSCYDGADVAINNLNPFYKNASSIDYVSMAKYYLNCLMFRRDLGFCSLTAIPHAMTKNAALAIGLENLAVPPKAHAAALYLKMKVDKPTTVDVFRSNKFRSYHNEVGEMILGDHVEAIHWLQEHTSNRVKFPDLYRKRSYSKIPMRVR